MVTRDKLGSCPDIPRSSLCSARSKECNYDMECKGELKCCDDGCGNKICTSTNNTVPSVGKSPFNCTIKKEKILEYEYMKIIYVNCG